MTQDQVAMLVFGPIFVVFGGTWAFRYEAVSQAMRRVSPDDGGTSPFAVRASGWLFFLVGWGLLIFLVVSLLS